MAADKMPRKPLKLGNHYWIIDALKAFFIISVLLIHLNNYTPLNWDKNVIYVFIISKAVPFFLVLSGFTYYLSMKKYDDWKRWYRLASLRRKLGRLIIPFMITFFIWLVYMKVGDNDISLIDNIMLLDIGPGTYYVVLMLQLVLVYPLIYAGFGKFGGG